MPTPITGTKDLVDEALLRQLDVDADDADYEAWTDRALSYAQTTVNELWGYSDWTWRRDSGPVGIAAGDGSGLMSDRFLSLGDQGQIYVDGQRRPPLCYMNPADLHRKVEEEAQVGDFTEFYTFDGAVGGVVLIHIYPINQNDITLNVKSYQRRRPDLTYDNPGGLDEIPADLYEILLFGLEDLLAMNGGDGRSLEQLSPRFRKALNQAKANEVPGHSALERIGARGVRRYKMW